MRLSIPVLSLLAIFLYRAPSRLASGATDLDYYWHLQYGDWILDRLQLPTTDTWSWTANGEPYRLTQWLGEVTMALAYRAGGGEFGTQVMSAILVTLTLAFSYHAARTYLPNRLAALSATLACETILLSLPCRPHQFTHLGLAILTALLAQYQQRNDRRLLLWLPVLMALWVNLHGGYAVGLAYLWLVVLTTAAERYMESSCDAIAQHAKPLAFAAMAATLASLCNPYGVGAWEYAIDVAQLKSSSSGVVDEWAPTSIKLDAGLMWFIAVTATAASMATSTQRPGLRTLLLFAALSGAGWAALRVSLMMSILMVPLIAAAMRFTPLYALAFDGLAARHDRSLRLWVATPLLMAFALGSLGYARLDKTPDNVIAASLPIHEVAFMKQTGIAGRILNSPEIGGYLIRNLGQPVSLDTRLDLHGDQRLFDFILARRGDASWRDYLISLDPDVLLIENLSALRQLVVEARMYRLVFEGSRYSILVRPESYRSLPTHVLPGN